MSAKQTVSKIGSEISSTTGGVWTRLPFWAKGIIVVGGGYLAYKGIKKVIGKTKLDETTRDDKQEVEGWYESSQQDAASKKPTLSKTQMKSIANRIEAALDGYGTRDTILKNIWKSSIKNDADFAGVNAAFGIRTIEAGRGTGWISGHERGTLTKVIQEADNSTLIYINNLMKQRGIKYRV
jgi:hypothetical protein